MQHDRGSFTMPLASPYARADASSVDDVTEVMLAPPVGAWSWDDDGLASEPESVTVAIASPAVVGHMRHPNVLTDFVAGLTAGELLRILHPRRLPLRIVHALFAGALRGLHSIHMDHREHGAISPFALHLGTDGIGRIVGPKSPRASARHVDPRADIRAIGTVLWEALDTVASPPPPGMLAEDVPLAFDALVARALSHQRSKCFSSALEMALALEHVFADIPTTHEVAAWLVVTAAEQLREQWKARAAVAVASR